MIEIKATPRFMRLAKKAMTPEALQELIDFLTLSPTKGSVIKGSGGIRKLRWKTGKGSTLRDGIRVLYYYEHEKVILLITLFKKSTQENVDAGELNELQQLINEFIGK